MVHSGDNETALYQDLDYLQVKEMEYAFFFGSGWKLSSVSGEGARELHVVL